jgi:uncharacterized RDD family membrane protein YckC
MSQINIVTAQNVVLKIELANIGDRFLASIIDFLIKSGITLIALFIKNQFEDTFVTFMVGVLMVITWVFYTLVFEQFMDGQTPGKRSRKIRVARLDGAPLTFGNLLLRWVLRIADFFVFIGLWMIVGTEKHQRLGDLAAGTILVSTRQRVSLDDTFYNEIGTGYVPTYPEAERLTSREAEIIQEVFFQYRQHDKYELVTLAANKVKELLQVHTYKDDLTFLKVVLIDYNYFGAHEAKPSESSGEFSVSI